MAKHGGRLMRTRIPLALAVSNLAVGLGRGLPVSGMSHRSSTKAGRAHAAAGRLAAGIILVVVLFSHCWPRCPSGVGGDRVGRCGSLFKLATLAAWRGDRPELGRGDGGHRRGARAGPLRGVIIGAIISLVLLIRRASRPHVAFRAHFGRDVSPIASGIRTMN
jgi:hypothetical protein